MKEIIEVELETDPEFNKLSKELENDINKLNRTADAFQKNMKSAVTFWDAETRKIQELTKIGEKQTQDWAKGFRQSHGEVVKLKKEVQEIADLFASLFKEPTKFKDFKPFKIDTDVLKEMQPLKGLAEDMADAGEAIRKEMAAFKPVYGEEKNLTSPQQTTQDLFGTLFKEPAKFKDFPHAKISPDVLEAMTPDLGSEMIEAASGVRATIAELQKASKSTVDFQKEWRKGLTGILIDLHWFRILASQSKVMSVQFTQMGKALGFLLDMALLPLLPAIIEVVKFVYSIALAITTLPKWFRSLLAVVIGAIVGFTVMETAIFFMIGLYNAVNAQLATFNVNLAAANAQMMAKTGMGVGVMGGAVGVGLGIGLLVVYLMQITGVLKAIYEFGRSTRKWLDQSIAIPIRFIKTILSIIFGIAAYILKTLYLIYEAVKNFAVGTAINIIDLGKNILDAIIKWVKDSLANAFDAGAKIIAAISEWISGGFKDPIGFLKKLIGIVVDWFNKQFSINTTLVKDIFGAFLGFFKKQFALSKEFVGALADIFGGVFKILFDAISNNEGFLGSIISTIVGIFKGIWEKLKAASDFLTQIKDIVVSVLKLVFDALLGDKEAMKKISDILTSFFEKLLEFLWGWIRERISRIPIVGGMGAWLMDQMQPDFKSKTPEVGGRQLGGFITQTGMYKLHAGEKVVPSHSVGDTSITINISGNADSKTIDELMKRMKQELTRVRA